MGARGRARPSFGMTLTFQVIENSEKALSYQKKDGRGQAIRDLFA